MGDISEYRGLIVAITFMGIFAVLIASIPSGFLGTAELEARGVSYPDNWDSTNMLYLSETYNYTTLGDSTEQDFDLGGRTQELSGSSGSGFHAVQLHYVWYDFWIFRNEEPCIWKTDAGFIVNASHQHSFYTEEMDAQFDTDDRFIAEFPYAGYHMYTVFSYDDGSYDNFTQAFSNDALYFWCGIQFDQTNTSYNAWDVIGMLLFFSLPDVHWAINALIAIPIWIVICYISFILILRVIGALFGGGA